jgi:hypothetical protein
MPSGFGLSPHLPVVVSSATQAGSIMRAITVIGSGMLVCACASSQVQQLPPQPIICMAGTDCEAKWSRAVAWITTNSNLKIQTKTETIIQTTGSVESAPTPAFTVTKVARGEGRYEITFNGGCGNASRCIATIAESRARFAEFVLAEAPAVSPSSR